ncbi:MAG: hypothetical protein GXO39_02815 [Thermotogae bacterium]|nr:hypothetical protein [Thermotogota bacterium]
MRRIVWVTVGLFLVIAACSGLSVDIRTDPQRFHLPIIGSSIPSGTLRLYAEKYIPLNDVPEGKKFVRFKEVRVSWKDSANLRVSYDIFFSDTGKVVKDPDSVKLYAQFVCTADTTTCNFYRGALQGIGYSLSDTVDLSKWSKLIEGETTPGKEVSYESYLEDEAVSTLDAAVEKRGVYVLVSTVLEVPGFSDTVRIKDLIMDIKAEFK